MSPDEVEARWGDILEDADVLEPIVELNSTSELLMVLAKIPRTPSPNNMEPGLQQFMRNAVKPVDAARIDRLSRKIFLHGILLELRARLQPFPRWNGRELDELFVGVHQETPEVTATSNFDDRRVRSHLSTSARNIPETTEDILLLDHSTSYGSSDIETTEDIDRRGDCVAHTTSHGSSEILPFGTTSASEVSISDGMTRVLARAVDGYEIASEVSNDAEDGLMWNPSGEDTSEGTPDNVRRAVDEYESGLFELVASDEEHEAEDGQPPFAQNPNRAQPWRACRSRGIQAVGLLCVAFPVPNQAQAALSTQEDVTEEHHAWFVHILFIVFFAFFFQLILPWVTVRDN